MIPRYRDIFLRAARTDEGYLQQQHVNLPPVDAPTCFHALNGRGQGVHRHPGNVKYRKLVFLNKGLYAKCPAAGKAKISKGIVAAIRGRGGRFLELDKQTGTCFDIGDKKAWEKTRQALREGQAKIRQKLHRKGAMSNSDASPSASQHGHLSQARFVPSEGYFRYSTEVLESLYSPDEAGDVASRTLAACQRAQSPSFTQTPQTAPGSGWVAQTPARRHLLQSSSPYLENEKPGVAMKKWKTRLVI